MMIVDAVSSAPTAAAVYFLLTAYLESLRHFQCAVPEGALALPVTSRTDLRQRLGMLERDPSEQYESTVVVTELAAVIRCALERLEQTGDYRAAQRPSLVRYGARNDSPHSSRSV